MQAIHATLKDRHRATRDGLPAGLNLRVHRALSWLQRAAQCDDPDARFIFLWIAFNAAYAQDIPPQQRLSEQDSFRAFLHKLHGLDAHRRLDDLVWHSFSGPIRILLDNPYVFESFWNFQRGEINATTWGRNAWPPASAKPPSCWPRATRPNCWRWSSSASTPCATN